jgi:hypothetical protein
MTSSIRPRDTPCPDLHGPLTDPYSSHPAHEEESY